MIVGPPEVRWRKEEPEARRFENASRSGEAGRHAHGTGAADVRTNKENVPRLSFSVLDLSREMTKHVDRRQEPALRQLLVALKMGLSLDGFCRRVLREMPEGAEVLRRTMRGLFAGSAAALVDVRVPATVQDARMHALALAKRRFDEREGELAKKRARHSA